MFSKRKTSIDRDIQVVEDMIRRWNELVSIYARSREQRQVSASDETRSSEILAWLQTNYPSIAKDMHGILEMHYIDPLIGVHIKNLDPILNLIMTCSTITEILSHPHRTDLENYLREGRTFLNYYLGYLRDKKASIGEIDVREYEALKSLYDKNIRENERLTQREELVKKLILKTRNFKTADAYFEEASSCFTYGLFRSSVIVAISALESCLKTDYRMLKKEEYKGHLYNLINRYFSGDIQRLPKQYEDFSKTYLKIRNSITHPEAFEFSETIVYNVLGIVAELINCIDKLW